MKEVLENIGKDLVKEIQKRLSSKNIDNTGSASNSLNVVATDSVLEIKGNRYIGALDKGRKPGKFPPPDVMLKWVQTKLGLSGSEAKSVAFLAGRKISKVGTEIYRDPSKGIELETIEEMGTEEIKKSVSKNILKNLTSKIHDLSKELK